MIRRFGENIVAGQAYRARPGAYAVLLDGKQILTTHQAQPVPEYQLPGGGIDRGEQALAALHREVHEETGWIIAEPRLFGIYRRFAFMPDYGFWAEKICRIYLARPVLRRSDPTEPGHSAVWMDARDALHHLDSAGDRAMLARVLRSR